jgi:two-component system LytT family sensor kinase
MKKPVIIFIHFSYWICYAILLVFILNILELNQSGEANRSDHYLKFLALGVIPALTVFYLSYFILFEKFLKKNKIVALCISIILLSYFTTSAAGVLLKFMLGTNILFDGGFIISIPLTFMVSSIPLVNGVFGIGMKAFISWFDEVKLREELSKKNFETELALVKSQINPHFLFNTINNIDTLIEIDSAKASQYLNKLSDIMRFMLYESKTGKIPVEKELHYIERYIDLQKIRTVNEKFVNFTVSGDPGSVALEPMLFIPFIENAFKYAENVEAENAINIHFTFKTGTITFRCENKYETINAANIRHGGLGNELIKKRLSLLFPKNHVLEMFNNNGIYTVNLIITQYEN